MNARDDDKPFLLVGTGSETVAPGLHILRGQGQSFVAETDAGLVVIDAGPGGKVSQDMIASLRQLSDAPVHALCYSHGHIGYNAGVPAWLEHAAARGEPVPRLIAHRNLPRRQARYRETLGAAAPHGRDPVQPQRGLFRAPAGHARAHRNLRHAAGDRQRGQPHRAVLGAVRDRRRHRAVEPRPARAVRRRGAAGLHPQHRHALSHAARHRALGRHAAGHGRAAPAQGRARVRSRDRGRAGRAAGATAHRTGAALAARRSRAPDERGPERAAGARGHGLSAGAVRRGVDEAHLWRPQLHRARHLPFGKRLVGPQPDHAAPGPARGCGRCHCRCHHRQARPGGQRPGAGRRGPVAAGPACDRRAGHGDRRRARDRPGPQPQGRLAARACARGGQLCLAQPLPRGGRHDRAGPAGAPGCADGAAHRQGDSRRHKETSA